MPSTVVSSFTYDAEKKILRIVFVTGMVYNYKNVPENIYHEMKNSFSKGIYFNQHVKNVFDFEKVN